MTKKFYDIYARGKCIYHHLPEKEFVQVWDMLDKFLKVSGAMEKEDISYEEVKVKT